MKIGGSGRFLIGRNTRPSSSSVLKRRLWILRAVIGTFNLNLVMPLSIFSHGCQLTAIPSRTILLGMPSTGSLMR